MPKTIVLFVDDEPNILSGLKRGLYSMKKEFSAYFADNGKDGLDLLKEHDDIDIVISDMHMPGIDGAQFLYEVQQSYPHAVRIVLSGQADDSAIVRTVGVAHQFLSKPCEPERLKEVLLRARALHQQLTNDELKDVISSIDSLPSLPTIYSELQKTLNNPDSTADDVAVILEKDMAMVAKLLQLVNSSFFGLYQKVDTPSRAVKLLGLETVKTLVLGVQIFNEFKTAVQPIPIGSLWDHSMMVANCSKKIAVQMTDDLSFINYSFIGGFLHDIGKLIFIAKFNTEYGSVVENAKENVIPLIDAEQAAFQSTHGDIGAYLLGLWGFNADLLEAVAFHDSIGNYPGDSLSVALVVHLANYCYYLAFPEEAVGDVPQLNEAYIKELGLEYDVESLIASGREYMLQSKNGGK
ncbi:response regulator [Desulfogranum japonicum]|uniref:response regulator n=1 Tax=Desulfogranum japonicum TaxID=231447 RepID=UPI00040D75E7|nr:response regulator [Desulfogranum japonicum]